MYDQPSNQNQSHNPNHTLIAVIASVLLFFTVIITIAIISPLLHHSSIAPIGPEASVFLSNADLQKVESIIKTHLSSTYNQSPDELSNLSIVIRENTLESKQNNSNSITTNYFIVDLNSPELTYHVTYQPSTKLVYLTCPTIDLAQNPEVFCIGSDNNSTIEANLDQYLPYQSTTTSDIDFSVSHHGGDSYSDAFLTIYASVCGDETLAQEVETEVKNWIRSKGIPNPDIIPLHFPHSYCNDK